MMLKQKNRALRMTVTTAVALGSTLLLTLLPAATAGAAATRQLCAGHSGEAGRMSDALGEALAHGGIVSVAFVDLSSGVACDVRGARHFESASVVKTAILATLLYQTQQKHSSLSTHDRALAHAMITRSDNDAASALWQQIGRASGLRVFLAAAGMGQTIPGPGRSWGLTQITAQDEIKLLRLLATQNGLLSTASRTYELGLMKRVVDSQRWGAPTGARAGEVVAVKNGWLPLQDGWHVNTTGVATGRRTYLLAVLTKGDPSMEYGVETVDTVARAINRNAF